MPKQQKQKYRLFTSDIGPMQFSAYQDTYTADPTERIRELSRALNTTAIALPHTRRDIWPDGKTGKLSAAAVLWLKSEGQLPGKQASSEE